jgi:hypothetical protein
MITRARRTTRAGPRPRISCGRLLQKRPYVDRPRRRRAPPGGSPDPSCPGSPTRRTWTAALPNRLHGGARATLGQRSRRRPWIRLARTGRRTRNRWTARPANRRRQPPPDTHRRRRAVRLTRSRWIPRPSTNACWKPLIRAPTTCSGGGLSYRLQDTTVVRNPSPHGNGLAPPMLQTRRQLAPADHGGLSRESPNQVHGFVADRHAVHEADTPPTRAVDSSTGASSCQRPLIYASLLGRLCPDVPGVRQDHPPAPSPYGDASLRLRVLARRCPGAGF